MEVEACSVQRAIITLKADLKAKNNTFAMLKASPTTETLRSQISEMELKKKETRERLDILKAENVMPVSREEKKHVEEVHKVAKTIYDRRMKIFWNIWQVVSDSYE